MMLVILLLIPCLLAQGDLFTSVAGTGYAPDGTLAAYQDCTLVVGGCSRVVATLPNEASIKPLNVPWTVDCNAYARESAVSENLIKYDPSDVTIDTWVCLVGDCPTRLSTTLNQASITFPNDFTDLVETAGWRVLPPGSTFKVMCRVTELVSGTNQFVEIEKEYMMEPYVNSDDSPALSIIPPLPGGVSAQVKNWRMKYVEVNTVTLSNLATFPVAVASNPYDVSMPWNIVEAGGTLGNMDSYFVNAGFAGTDLQLSVRPTPGEEWILYKNLYDAGSATDGNNVDILMLQWFEEKPKISYVLEGSNTKPSLVEGPTTIRVVLDSTGLVKYDATSDPIVREWDCNSGLGVCDSLLTIAPDTSSCVFNDALADLTPGTYAIRVRACVATACSDYKTTDIVVGAAADKHVGINANNLGPDGTFKPNTGNILSFTALENIGGVSMDSSRRAEGDLADYVWFVDDVAWVPADTEVFDSVRGKFANIDTSGWADGSTHEVKVKVNDGTMDVVAAVEVVKPVALAAGVTVLDWAKAIYEEPVNSVVRAYSYGFNDKSGGRREGGWADVFSPDDALWKDLNIFLTDPTVAKTTSVYFPRSADMNVWTFATDPAGNAFTADYTRDTTFMEEPSYDFASWTEPTKWDFLQRAYHASYNAFCPTCSLLAALDTHKDLIFTGTQDSNYLHSAINLLYRTLKDLSGYPASRRDITAPTSGAVPTCNAGVPGHDDEDQTFVDHANAVVGNAVDALSNILDDYSKDFPDEDIIVDEMLDLLNQYPNVVCAASDCFMDLLLKAVNRRDPTTLAVEYANNAFVKAVLAAANTDGTTCYDKKCFKLTDAAALGTDAVVVLDWIATFIDVTSSARRTDDRANFDGTEYNVDVTVYDNTVEKNLDNLKIEYEKRPTEDSDDDEFVCVVDGAVDSVGTYCTLTETATSVTCDCTKDGVGSVGVRNVGAPGAISGEGLSNAELTGVVVGSVAGVAFVALIIGLVVLVILAGTGVICARKAAAPATPVAVELEAELDVPTQKEVEKEEEKHSSTSSSSSDD